MPWLPQYISPLRCRRLLPPKSWWCWTTARPQWDPCEGYSKSSEHQKKRVVLTERKLHRSTDPRCRGCTVLLQRAAAVAQSFFKPDGIVQKRVLKSRRGVMRAEGNLPSFQVTRRSRRTGRARLGKHRTPPHSWGVVAFDWPAEPSCPSSAPAVPFLQYQRRTAGHAKHTCRRNDDS